MSRPDCCISSGQLRLKGADRGTVGMSARFRLTAVNPLEQDIQGQIIDLQIEQARGRVVWFKRSTAAG